MASQNDTERSWSDLPIEILELITSFLPLSDHPYFASVCKSWSLVISPLYPADRCPLLMYYHNWGSGICRYYSPLFNKTFIIDCPLDLSDTIFRFARDGWLLLSRESETILANPITGTLHVLPDFNFCDFRGLAFSGRPFSDFIIFAIESILPHSVWIAICRGQHWNALIAYHNNLPFVISKYSNPVFFRGLFYCLGAEGNLGVFDPVEDTWSVLAEPKQFDVYYEESYLVESEGELLSFLISKHGTAIHAFRLNQVHMVWENVESLGSRTLFAGSQMSLLTTTAVGRMENRVYVPRLHGKPETIEAEVKCSEGQIFFITKLHSSYKPRVERKRTGEVGICYYSLENGEHTKYFGSKEYICSIWFEPKFDV